jgi:hypothetical protein
MHRVRRRRFASCQGRLEAWARGHRRARSVAVWRALWALPPAGVYATRTVTRRVLWRRSVRLAAAVGLSVTRSGPAERTVLRVWATRAVRCPMRPVAVTFAAPAPGSDRRTTSRPARSEATPTIENVEPAPEPAAEAAALRSRFSHTSPRPQRVPVTRSDASTCAASLPGPQWTYSALPSRASIWSAPDAYEVSTDAGATWHALAATAGAGATLNAALAGLTNGSTYHVLVRALNARGAGDPSAGVALALAPVVINAAVRSISIVTRKAKLAAGKGRVTKIRLSCIGLARCIGTLTVTKVIRVHGKRRTVTLGRARYSIAGGRSANVKVTLTKAARTLLGRAPHHTITARVNVKLGTQTSRRNITITRAKVKARTKAKKA